VKENTAQLSDKKHKRKLETDQDDAASQEKKKQKFEQIKQLDNDTKEGHVNVRGSEEVEVEKHQAPQVDEIS
jgi:hypothetical protein